MNFIMSKKWHKTFISTLGKWSVTIIADQVRSRNEVAMLQEPTDRFAVAAKRRRIMF
jgi:hypothetical protein